MAKIIVNGETQEVSLPLTVEELIKLNDVAQPDMVSVQLNDEFLTRSDYRIKSLNEGDEIEFLYFMGGGERYV
jgi:sulfur carrier protein